MELLQDQSENSRWQGNHEPEYAYGKTASKTINIITVFMLFKIETAKDLKAKVYDIPGAYLKTIAIIQWIYK